MNGASATVENVAAPSSERPETAPSPAGMPAVSIWSGRVLKSAWLFGLAWVAGRGYEVITGQSLAAPGFMVALSITGLLLFALYVSLKALVLAKSPTRLGSAYMILPWLSALLFVFWLAYSFTGYRIASLGLASLAGGLEYSAGQAVFLVMKFAGLTLAAPLAAGIVLPFVYNPPVGAMAAYAITQSQLAVFCWFSLGLAAALFFIRSGNGFPKLVCLLAALFGVLVFSGALNQLAVLLFRTGMSSDFLHWFRSNLPLQITNNRAWINLHMAVIVMAACQILLLHSSLRRMAKQRDRETANSLGALSLLAVAVFLMPLFADIYNRLQMAWANL